MSQKINTITNKTNDNNDNNDVDDDNAESIYDITNQASSVTWSIQHEKILVDWADKATCYKWLHEKTHREFARKNR